MNYKNVIGFFNTFQKKTQSCIVDCGREFCECKPNNKTIVNFDLNNKNIKRFLNTEIEALCTEGDDNGNLVSGLFLSMFNDSNKGIIKTKEGKLLSINTDTIIGNNRKITLY